MAPRPNRNPFSFVSTGTPRTGCNDRETCRRANCPQSKRNPMRILLICLREFVNVAAHKRDRRHRQGRAISDRTSAAGAKELSPALQRWVNVSQRAESRRDGRGNEPAVPTALQSIFMLSPALKHWADSFFPVGGTGPSPMLASFLTSAAVGRATVGAWFLRRSPKTICLHRICHEVRVRILHLAARVSQRHGG